MMEISLSVFLFQASGGGEDSILGALEADIARLLEDASSARQGD